MYKQTLSVFMLMAATAAQATPANSFNCEGRNISATYITQSQLGSSLSIKFKGQLFRAENEAIQEQRTVLGRLLTLTVNAQPDQYTDTLTLSLPDVNLPTFNSDPVSFRTRLYATRSFTTIGGPGLVNGVVQDNASYVVMCTATAAVF